MHALKSKLTTRIATSVLGALGVVVTLIGGTAAADAQGMPAPAPMSMPVPFPPMAGPLSDNPNPMSFDLGELGEKVYVTGAVTGLAFWQNHATGFFPGDFDSEADLSNAQVTIQKTDGLVQYMIQAGEYSTPSLGLPYIASSKLVPLTFGVMPQAFLKIVPNENFSIQAGKLPTLIGDEYFYTFQNMNIERGLLWNQEPLVSTGVQANYTNGPIALSLSLNDGYYSNRWNWVSGLAAYTIDPMNTIALAAGGNMGRTGYGTTFATPTAQNNGSIYNVIYTHTDGPWVISPYFQYQQIGSDVKLGFAHSTSAVSGAVLVSYAFDDNFKLAGRFEYISTSGNGPNILYGNGSKAWSFTITPTYQYKIYFARAEFSYVGVSSGTVGAELGPFLDQTSQSRLMVETGIIF